METESRSKTRHTETGIVGKIQSDTTSVLYNKDPWAYSAKLYGNYTAIDCVAIASGPRLPLPSPLQPALTAEAPTLYVFQLNTFGGYLRRTLGEGKPQQVAVQKHDHYAWHEGLR